CARDVYGSGLDLW
nr:immunoglobulin heavy chain junction region [Macaca mulatta]MOX94870.1 immunoglobulin heavy chain junction region [Macaca mulatta]